MNSSHLLFLTSGWSYLLLLGLVGIGNISAMPTDRQTAGDTTEVINLPIDTERSLISWKGTEMWELGKHEGTVDIKEGYVLHEDDLITGGHFIIDMNSITITDIPEHEPVPRKRLRDHLKSEDFFYVEKYPTAEFEITKTEALENNQIRIWGDLSIRDVTKAISFTASQNADHKAGLEFNADFKINRFDWNVSYQGSYWERISSILDNNLVDDEIWLSIKLVPTLVSN